MAQRQSPGQRDRNRLRFFQQRSCGHKIQHWSWDSAWEHAHSLPGLEPYLCRFCGAYHVGHPPRAARRVR